MQTFLPYAQFKRSAEVLDDKRLMNQRGEVLTLLRSLAQGPLCLYSAQYGFRYGAELREDLEEFIIRKTPWWHHPAAQMWRDCSSALAWYGMVICDECLRRGFKDTCSAKVAKMMTEEPSYPPWLGDERLHSSHRSNLLRKDYEHYSAFGWYETPGDDYWWPTQTGE